MNPVVHFEMPYTDGARAAKFYASAFGWKTESLGADMGDYVTLETAETKDGRPTQPGTINGGLWKKDASRPDQVPSVVIAVDDMAAALRAVEAADGEVLGEPWDIPGVGQYVSIHDTEGNRVSLLKPSR